ncbi:MAG TPA: hypothetical protein EYH25_01235, partial [Thermotoga sp.]|nr:hypothetical protein [Thermotoga sp.]
MDKIKVGFVGGGFIARVHMEILSNREDVEIAGIIEPDESRAKSISEKYGARIFERLKDMKDAGIDAVYITSPNFTHFLYASEAVELGFSVF